ncbi:hypothetical protein QFZ73_004043 [Peribacillus sp. V2I11]|nr:hypothetical protein [Peribacillus sp. V2I11]
MNWKSKSGDKYYVREGCYTVFFFLFSLLEMTVKGIWNKEPGDNKNTT